MTENIYHGSQHLFDRFTLNHAGRGRQASNGALGIWVTPLLKLATAFGGTRSGYLYEVASSTTPVKSLPLSWLEERHEEADRILFGQGIDAAIAFYDRLRLGFLESGFGQLWITEKDGSAPTRVYLDPENIEILSVVDMTSGRSQHRSFDAAREVTP